MTNPEKREIARRMYTEGVRLWEIAEAIGVATLSGVYTYLDGLPRRADSGIGQKRQDYETKRLRVRQMYADDVPVAEIAAAMGFTSGASVYHYLDGVPRHNPRHRPPRSPSGENP